MQPTRKLELTDSGLVVESYEDAEGKIVNKPQAFTKQEILTMQASLNASYQAQTERIDAMLALANTHVE